jgi:hypothetical protein
MVNVVPSLQIMEFISTIIGSKKSPSSLCHVEDIDFWNFAKGSTSLKHIMSRDDRGTTLLSQFLIQLLLPVFFTTCDPLHWTNYFEIRLISITQNLKHALRYIWLALIFDKFLVYRFFWYFHYSLFHILLQHSCF